MSKKIYLILCLINILFTNQILAQTPSVEISPTQVQTPTAIPTNPGDEIKKQIDDYNQKLIELSKSKDTLYNQIKIFNLKIAQTQLIIKQSSATINTLRKSIANLSTEINKLDTSISDLSAIYIKDVNQNYKLQKKNPFYTMITSGNFNKFFENYKYLSIIQKDNQNTLSRLEALRENLNKQKLEKAQKQTELEATEKEFITQQNNLAEQKSSKTNLLLLTKNDEAKYQALLNQAMAEYEAIQNILIGNGDEIVVGETKRGDKIASLIQGPSCNSSGTHLHFMVKVNNSPQNPFNNLKPGVEFIDHSSGDPFNPSGSWNWPLKEVIAFEQGYGVTEGIKNKSWFSKLYSFHTGIDIYSKSTSDVFATHDGTLYRGKFSYNGCVLKYVKIKDKTDSNLTTLYLHVNYL
jgi:peptidoglycan hydrolase CwlO-like protein